VLEVVERQQEGREPAPHDCMVVDDHDLDGTVGVYRVSPHSN